MLGQVVGSVVPLVRLPVTLLQGVESVLGQLTSVATRAAAVLDDIEGLPDRVAAVLERAEAVPARIDAVLTRTELLTAKVDAVVADAAATLAGVQPAVRAIAGLDPQLAARLVEGLALLVDGARRLDPSLVDDATAAARGLPLLLSTVDDKLLPALASLEQLVPVVAQLGIQVDHLDATVADVGTLLGGIPGAARLLKRGETRPNRA